ncbi:glycosyltransferase [Niallia sp. Krafla_26]|uniref:glycosyltransferase n=1 Tax=Niallia sp. Krafla_26 TaxID=3064703 RepID=UPI003D171FDF
MKVIVVIVLYKVPIEHCKTLNTIKRNLAEFDFPNNQIEFVIYDHSPEMQEIPDEMIVGCEVSYIHDSRNLGIATAYNYALKRAQDLNAQWLILFDHDTEVTRDYIRKISTINEIDASVVAIVPKINHIDKMISPVFSDTLQHLKGEKPNPGIQNKEIMAINSASILRVSFLTEIGGFNEEFPLDYLDHWLFNEIFFKNYKVYVLDTVIQHELSVMDYNQVSLWRYQSILDSEINFYKNYKRDLLRQYKMQLLKRLCKQILLVSNKKIAFYTLRKFFSLLKGNEEK